MSERKNPYVGPRTFTYEDREWFFGRERNARRLLARVVSEQLVLFYAQSGVGKSSLINTRLIPQLGDNGFEVLPVGSVGGGLPSELGDVDNVFSFNLILSLDPDAEDPGRFSDTKLPEFLALLRHGEKPRVLIVDQFEQIATSHQDRWRDRTRFFGQLDQAMTNDPNLWVVLVVREDYVASLEPYAHLLRDQMRARFHMQRLNTEAALEAITKPAEKAGRRFSAEAADGLVTDLCQIRVPGHKDTREGEFVDPILLQVVCHNLWENLRGKPPGEISIDDLRKAGDIPTALRKYFEGAVEAVRNEWRTTEGTLRDWFDQELITQDGIRNIVRQEKTHTAGLPNKDVDILANRFVLRPVVRSGETWYELAHDRLVQPILDANQEYRDKSEQKRPWAVGGSGMPGQAAYLPSESDSNQRRPISVDVYVQTFEEQRDGQLSMNEIYVPWEPGLMAGPTSARIAVVDYDADTGKLEDPVQWDGDSRRFAFERDGELVPLMREHRDLPQFHQASVWAVIKSILEMYEAPWVLGHPIPWAFEGNRLIVRPHARQGKTPFYDRRGKSLEFPYFDDGGRTIHTCLPHDIVAHVTGHAMLDGLRPHFYEGSSLQTAAFHEFVADLTAIMISLFNNPFPWEVAEVPDGDLHGDEIIAALAEEFGYYAAGRPYLLSALNTMTMQDVAGSSIPRSWSQVLTGVMWDILTGMFATYRARPQEHSGRLPTNREAFLWAVYRFQRVALQPLDYLPPVDVQFSDYARAVLRADDLVDPVDEYALRGMMVKLFERRGIATTTEEGDPGRIQFYAHDFDRVSLSRTDAGLFLHENRRQLCIPPDQDISVADLYRTDKVTEDGGRLPGEIVLQYVWREEVSLEGGRFGPYRGRKAFLFCGGTLVFDERGNILHWVRKPGSGSQKASVGRRRSYCEGDRAKGLERRKQFLDYVASRIRSGQLGPADSEEPGES